MYKFISSILFIFFILQNNAMASEKVTVLLDWFLNPGHAPLFVAKEKGFFQQQNLDVELIGPADPSDPPKLVAAEKADIGITYEPQFLQQINQGLPLARIGALIDKPLSCLVVLKDGPIKSIKDLKGKRIGQSTGSVSSVMLQTMLEKNGLSIKDVKAINVHYDLSQALLSKKVDAVTGMMRNFEVIQMDLNKHAVNTFFPEENGVPKYSELIFIVNKNQVDDKRWNKFLTAIQQANHYLQKHPEEMWDAFAKAHPELNDELNHKAWFASLPYFAKNPGYMNKQEQTNFKSFMEKNGLLNSE